MISILNLYPDIQEMFTGTLNERSVGDRSVLDGWNPIVNGRPHFQYLWGHPNFCVPDPNRPCIFFHGLRTGQQFGTMGRFVVPVELTVGVYRVCGKGHQHFETMRSTIKQFFGLQTWNMNTFDFTFQGVPYVGVSLADFGFRDVSTGGDTELPDACGCVLWETVVSFRLNFERKLTF